MTDPIDVLRVKLSQAFEPVVQSAADKREQLAAALGAVASFLAETVGRAPADEFFELGSAIADLNSGAVHPLLEPPSGTYYPTVRPWMLRVVTRRRHGVRAQTRCLPSKRCTLPARHCRSPRAMSCG
jgi:hypothetical protein